MLNPPSLTGCAPPIAPLSNAVTGHLTTATISAVHDENARVLELWWD